MDLESLNLVELVGLSLGCGFVLRFAAEGVQAVGALIYTLLRGI